MAARRRLALRQPPSPFTREKLTCSLLLHPPPQILIKEGASSSTHAGYKVINVSMAKEINLSPLGFMILKALVLSGRVRLGAQLLAQVCGKAAHDAGSERRACVSERACRGILSSSLCLSSMLSLRAWDPC